MSNSNESAGPASFASVSALNAANQCASHASTYMRLSHSIEPYAFVVSPRYETGTP